MVIAPGQFAPQNGLGADVSTTTSERTWRKGELYHVLCLLGIAECIWLIGVKLDLFRVIEAASVRYGLADLIMLGCVMSIAVATASALRSLQMRREMAAREEAEAHAQALARHDTLTGLPNRRLLNEAIRGAVRTGANHAILLVDLDRFKPVNDVHGHAAGDAVLCEAAERIKTALLHGGMVARLGGDEFAVLIRYGAKSDLMRTAQQIIIALSAPFSWNSAEFEVGATIGLALLPEDGSEPDDLLRCADIAMYRGKREGRATYRFFEQAMDNELKARAALESELRVAIAKGEIKPHYQPLVSLQDKQLLGFEVLARWYHPQRGILSPDLFIPICEDAGLITELSYGLLRSACLDAAAWPPHLRLALNISPYQLRDRWLPERLLAILTETGFAPSRFEVEITETALAADLDAARTALTSLQNVGVSIALDDFGTGYSSLYHLRELRFDKIKIDRSFVQALNQNAESTKIVDAIINLGKSLGLLTTAEGIEDNENRDWLAQQGCSYGQGYLFGAPMPAKTIDGLLQDGEDSFFGTETVVPEAVMPLRGAA